MPLLKNALVTSVLMTFICSQVSLAENTEEIELMKTKLGYSEEQAREVLEKREWSRIEYSNLPITYKAAYERAFKKAAELLLEKEHVQAYGYLTRAEVIFKEGKEVNILFGGVYSHLRIFQEGVARTKRALKLYPLDISLNYRLGGFYFALRDYKKAKAQFLIVDKILEGDRSKKPVLLAHFQRQLCLLGEIRKAEKTGKDSETLQAEFEALNAEGREWNHDLLYYYSGAILKFQEQEVNSAKKWLKDAKYVFPKAAEHVVYTNSLSEYGFINSYYGGERGDEKEELSQEEE